MRRQHSAAAIATAGVQGASLWENPADGARRLQWFLTRRTPLRQSVGAASCRAEIPTRLFFRSLQYRIEFAVFCAAAALARALPLERASTLSGRIWRWIAPLSKRHARALQHLRLAFPEKSDGDRQAIALDMWETLGRIFGESFHLDEILDSDRIVFENLDELVADGRCAHGVVGCSAHLGNWEIAASLSGNFGSQALGIYQRVKNPLVDERIRSMRARLYPGGLLAKSQAAGIAAIRHVKSGGTLVMLADLRDRNGYPAPFFGRPAPSTTFPALVARTLNRPLLAVAVVREPGVRFRIRGEFVDVPRTDDRAADIERGTENLQRKLEDFVRANPSQWMWAHRRWG